VFRATRRFVASFASDALPIGPTWTVRFAMAANTGRHRSISATSPPAKIVQSPRSTIELVPLIGVSRNPIPAEAAASPSRRVRVGEIVLIWMMVAEPATVPRRPPEPSTVASTASSEGRIVNTASAPVTASVRLAAGSRPRRARPVS